MDVFDEVDKSQAGCGFVNEVDLLEAVEEYAKAHSGLDTVIAKLKAGSDTIDREEWDAMLGEHGVSGVSGAPV